MRESRPEGPGDDPGARPSQPCLPTIGLAAQDAQDDWSALHALRGGFVHKHAGRKGMALAALAVITAVIGWPAAREAGAFGVPLHETINSDALGFLTRAVVADIRDQHGQLDD